MNIAIRADGSPQIGMGHIIRCLSLAREFRSSGCRVFFISSDPLGINAIEAQGFEAKIIDTQLDFGITPIKDILISSCVDCLIIDTYRVNPDYFFKLKTLVKLLCYIDDLNLFTYPVDVLINGNIGAETMYYRPYSDNELLLLGPSFNLIREEFRGLSIREANSKINRVFVTMGGSDPHHVTGKIIQTIKESPFLALLNWDIVIGGGFTHPEDLYELSKDITGIRLYENVARMSELMLQADLAVSAGGSSLYELCACGVPSLAIIVADNQKYIVECFTELGYIQNLGWHESVEFDAIERVIRDDNLLKRRAVIKTMQQFVDGYGTVRVKDNVLEYFNGLNQ